jgi:thioredoxin-like negative regulator of GroEL
MFAAMMHASVVAAGQDSYAAAYMESVESRKPMVVMVSTEWCPPCQQMKRHVLPEVRKQGFLDGVCFANVDPDHEPSLARQLIGRGPVPQLLMYRSTPNGWLRRKLVGGQSVRSVQGFIHRGLELDAATWRAATQATAASSAPSGRLAKVTAETP